MCNLQVGGGNLSEPLSGPAEHVILQWQFQTNQRNCANKTMCLSQVFVIQLSRIEQNEPKFEQNQGKGPSRAFLS